MFVVYFYWSHTVSQVEEGCKQERGCPPIVTPGTGALASVPHSYGTQQVRGLFSLLIEGDYFVLPIYCLAHRHLRTGPLAEQLLQMIKAKAKWECTKEKGL